MKDMNDTTRASGTKPAILQAHGVTKTFGAGSGLVQVLKGIDLELNPGELTLLMGPSGSGKTTLLSILGCIMTPSEGHLSIAGHSTAGLGSEAYAQLRRKHIGLVFQSYNLFPTLTALENVMLALDVRNTWNDPVAEAADALEAVGLGHRINTYPAKLSGGEKQRVAIARALAGKPSVILADEPTAALDSENGAAVMALLSEVAQDPGRAVLAVTHDHRILSYADRILRIEDGHMAPEEDARAGAGNSGKVTH